LPAIYCCRLCLLNVSMESCLFPLLPFLDSLVERLASCLLLQALLTKSLQGQLPLPPSLVERPANQLLLQALFTESSCGEQLLALPPSPMLSKHPTLFSAYPFQFLFYYSVFFVGQGSVCPGGSAGLSQGWLWKYHVLLICSPVGLHLPSRFGAGVWWSRSPPGFSV
jgi:hypothetical protein